MELTFNKTNMPIASIRGGKYDGKILFMNEKDKDNDINKDINGNPYIINQILKNKNKNLKIKQYEKLLKYCACDCDHEGEEEEEDNPFREYKKEYQEIKNKDFFLNSGTMELLPTVEDHQTDAVYISGPRGSGKSTFCRLFIKNYHKMYPKRDIMIISREENDPVFKKLKCLQKVSLDDDFIDDPIQLEDIKNSLVIFDDYENFGGEMLQAIEELRDDILNNGRKLGISILICQHATCNNKKTKTQLFESDKYVLYPKGGTAYTIKRVITQYLGLTNKDYKKIMDLPSRWICIKKTYPRYCLHEHGCFLL